MIIFALRHLLQMSMKNKMIKNCINPQYKNAK
ncbi:MAG: hypothetical protein K0R49_1486 [Burkholderiales bacterium]|jgi:hypothetical protein|nr:hypothetical protein [Burkholderiales bacterium]